MADDTITKGTTTACEQEDHAWHVHVFRFSESQGWELYQEVNDTTSTSNSSSTSSNTSNQEEIIPSTNSKNEKIVAKVTPGKGNSPSHDEEEQSRQDMAMTVVPKKGCVEVKKLRLRVHLFVQSTKEDGTEVDVDCVDYVHTSIIRRRNMILLSPKTGKGAVVLQFKSISESLEFSDRLLELNAECALDREKTKSEQRPNKMRRLDEEELNRRRGRGEDSLNKESNSEEKDCCEPNDGTKSSAEKRSGRKALIQSYIVKLLHDHDFLAFVDGVEENLLSSSDCAGILEALEYPRAR